MSIHTRWCQQNIQGYEATYQAARKKPEPKPLLQIDGCVFLVLVRIVSAEKLCEAILVFKNVELGLAFTLLLDEVRDVTTRRVLYVPEVNKDCGTTGI